MQVTECAICALALAKYSCNLCGKSVCADCYDKNKGVCILCKQGKRI